MTCPLTIVRGSLHLEQATYDRYFAGLAALILLRRDCDLLILPVRHAPAGGYLVKRRNAKGDRVVSAADFFRREGIADERELALDADWSAEAGGPVATGVFAAAHP
jgi:hypothetical protein